MAMKVLHYQLIKINMMHYLVTFIQTEQMFLRMIVIMLILLKEDKVQKELMQG